MRTYHYVLFLKHPETHDCINHHIELDSDGEYMDARELFAKLHGAAEEQFFSEGYTLIGFNISNVEEMKNEN
ncbi:hypothetical protein N5J31_01945 [Acinetobacter johnsonii]|uniref:hypothetical protein n=1 Tax=Acinetobacter johnsonii TaxID=40214 RepID=UPI002446C14A|nr:hypothetical protein [Acinetobacter johnsonii]MDH2045690.1 hypothetical protein [Acinetobacter johnsonii]